MYIEIKERRIPYETPTEVSPLKRPHLSSDECSLPLIRTLGQSNGCPYENIFNDLMAAGDGRCLIHLIKLLLYAYVCVCH